MGKIMLLTSQYTGRGHMSIAEALMEHFERMKDLTVDVVDGFIFMGRQGVTNSKIYNVITRRAKFIWKAAFEATQVGDFVPHNMGYLVQKGYFDTIPATIHEAARIDGATNLQIFTEITLPLSKPMIVYTALTQFAWPWSDCLLPKLLLKNRDQWTVAVGLFSMPETHFSRFAAGSVFIAVPIVILYFCLVKHIVNGLTAGAVKG